MAGARPEPDEGLQHRRTNLSLRWDVFNVFNTVNFGLPNADVSSASVGTISQLAGDPRLMQFSARLRF